MKAAMQSLRFLAVHALLAATLVNSASATEAPLNNATTTEATLAVAANFTDTCKALVERFEQQSSYRLRVVYGSTGKLYAQIAHGAPFDVLLAADVERPRKAEQEGLSVAGSRFTYASGQLVLFSTRADLFGHSFRDALEWLKQGQYQRLAIANPDTAPYGAAARDVLQQLHLWDDLQPRLVRGESISQTFQFAASGNADAGFVALSQMHAMPDNVSVVTIPSHLHTPIEQQAVLLTRGQDNAAAREFLAWLRSHQARQLIREYGYQVE